MHDLSAKKCIGAFAEVCLSFISPQLSLQIKSEV